MQIHFPEFLQHGYKSSIGNIECKFPHRDSTRGIGPFSVGVTDGHTKVILMMTVVAMVKELEFGAEQLQDKHLAMVLASFAQIRCSYEHYSNPAHFFLHSLRSLMVCFTRIYFSVVRSFSVSWVLFSLWSFPSVFVHPETGFVSAEKQAPSPVELVAELSQAVDLQRRQKQAPLRDLLSKIVAEYNRMVTQKRHRLDACKKALVLNLTLLQI